MLGIAKRMARHGKFTNAGNIQKAPDWQINVFGEIAVWYCFVVEILWYWRYKSFVLFCWLSDLFGRKFSVVCWVHSHIYYGPWTVPKCDPGLDSPSGPGPPWRCWSPTFSRKKSVPPTKKMPILIFFHVSLWLLKMENGLFIDVSWFLPVKNSDVP